MGMLTTPLSLGTVEDLTKPSWILINEVVLSFVLFKNGKIRTRIRVDSLPLSHLGSPYTCLRGHHYLPSSIYTL